ncbi:hypothetical protein MAPG_05369 [Magnaporthiopsis poae ATCC 64411]|uniref:Uncharacterized protein n=1 Tax=Magnaporthiopsis poae (strain ATCC 64411 / 73-15) TaxID=644358 RepID=A0A0C4DZ77_MAGP6|nr:hypothetical protein MAPG_05369 [Magnaporthiopsis poae ATCC 64411]
MAKKGKSVQGTMGYGGGVVACTTHSGAGEADSCSVWNHKRHRYIAPPRGCFVVICAGRDRGMDGPGLFDTTANDLDKSCYNLSIFFFLCQSVSTGFRPDKRLPGSPASLEPGKTVCVSCCGYAGLHSITPREKVWNFSVQFH